MFMKYFRRLCLIFAAMIVATLIIALIVREQRTYVEVIGESRGDRGSVFTYQNRMLISQSDDLMLFEDQLTLKQTIRIPCSLSKFYVSKDLSLAVIIGMKEFCVVDIETGQTQVYPLSKFCFSGYLSPDGKQFWISEYETGVIYRYGVDRTRAALQDEFNLKELLETANGVKLDSRNFDVLANSPTQSKIYVQIDNIGAIYVIDWTNRKLVGAIAPILGQYHHHEVSPDGNLLLMVYDSINVIDLNKDSIVMQRELHGYARAGSFDSSSEHIYVGYSGASMCCTPLMSTIFFGSGQIEKFDLNGNSLKLWHSKANYIHSLRMTGNTPVMQRDGEYYDMLQTIRLP